MASPHLALLLIAVAIFVVNFIWFRPWSLNLFYEKVFAQVLFEEPELLSSVGLVEQFGITGHNARLGDAFEGNDRLHSPTGGREHSRQLVQNPRGQNQAAH